MAETASDTSERVTVLLPRTLRNLRLAAGKTLDDVASAVGASRQAVLSWETGRTRPNTRYFRAYADALGVSVEALLGLVDQAIEQRGGYTPPGMIQALTPRKRPQKARADEARTSHREAMP